MEELIIELYKCKIQFSFNGSYIVLGKFDTGFYGIIETTIIYYKDFYLINYTINGYPFSKSIKDVKSVIDFILILNIHS